ncbi:hypothetical protein F2Q69_00059631 [Brassica cretica]|uniref:Uncharacterized protein n=1 Tax=Brassica cretica TaxID=69181 RepID=A0A8S9RMV0_BRACR|nr:hypothetical protein F2Q69_00059631 [Brassica cretica]
MAISAAARASPRSSLSFSKMAIEPLGCLCRSAFLARRLRPTISRISTQDLNTVYRVDRAVVLDLASASETLETVRGGYCGAYLSFFQSCGLTFPIPEPVLEILAELGLSFTQILPNFLRHLIALLVRAREEGLSFGLSEFRHLVLVKRNMQSPKTFLVSPRPGRHVIEDVPYCDKKWLHSGSSLMPDEIRSLIGVLRRDRSNWSSFDQSRIRAAFAMPEGTNRPQPVIGSYEDEAERSQEVMEAFNEYVLAMEDRVEENATLAAQVVTQRAKIAALEVDRDRDIRRASRVARRDVAGRCREILEFLKEKWENKKKEASAEIQSQEVVSNIDLLNELKDGGLNKDAELARLKEMEKDCEGLVALAAVSDWSVSGFDLSQVSKDSVDQAGGSSVPDGADSS